MGRRSRAKEQRLNNCNRARLAKAEKATMPIPSPDESPLGHPARESSPNLECPAVGPATRSAIGPRGGTSRWTAWRARRPKKKPQYPSHDEDRYESRVLKLKGARIRLKKKLRSPRQKPMGEMDQDWHRQVLQLINKQLFQPNRNRALLALSVVEGYGRNRKVARRLLMHENLWITTGSIPQSSIDARFQGYT
jgi:hypothetical protein